MEDRAYNSDEWEYDWFNLCHKKKEVGEVSNSNTIPNPKTEAEMTDKDLGSSQELSADCENDIPNGSNSDHDDLFETKPLEFKLEFAFETKPASPWISSSKLSKKMQQPVFKGNLEVVQISKLSDMVKHNQNLIDPADRTRLESLIFKKKCYLFEKSVNDAKFTSTNVPCSFSLKTILEPVNGWIINRVISNSRIVLFQLPIERIISILLYLEKSDILNLMATCKASYAYVAFNLIDEMKRISDSMYNQSSTKKSLDPYDNQNDAYYHDRDYDHRDYDETDESDTSAEPKYPRLDESDTDPFSDDDSF